MIVSLARAEIIKATGQRGTFFSAYLIVPCFMTLLTVILGSAILPNAQATADIRLLHSMTRALVVGGNPIAQLFYALGAASIFTVDYRYSGWRHIVPRASRPWIMSAKALTFGTFVALTLLLAAGGDAVANLVVAVARGMKPIVTDFDGASAIHLVGAFVISLAELLTLGAFVAAVATMTRSMMAAVVLPFLVSLAASSAEAYFGSSSGGVHLPNIAADTLRAALDGEATSSIVGSVGTLAVWCATGALLTVGVFQRQDFVTE